MLGSGGSRERLHAMADLGEWIRTGPGTNEFDFKTDLNLDLDQFLILPKGSAVSIFPG